MHADIIQENNLTHKIVDDSEPRQLLHSGRDYWISGPAG